MNLGGGQWGDHCNLGTHARGGSCTTFTCDCICFSCMIAKEKESEDQKKMPDVKKVPRLGYLTDFMQEKDAWVKCFVCGEVSKPNTHMLVLFGGEAEDVVGWCKDHQTVLLELLLQRWISARKGMLPGAPADSLSKEPTSSTEVQKPVGKQSA